MPARWRQPTHRQASGPRTAAGSSQVLFAMNPPIPAKILLVDDTPSKLFSLATLLENSGHQVVQAKSGKEALRILLKQDFALILLDVSMPGMDGFETAQLIRQRKNSEFTPIIFITGIS